MPALTITFIDYGPTPCHFDQGDTMTFDFLVASNDLSATYSHCTAHVDIRDADGQVIAAINVSTHAGRRTLNSIVEELLQPLLATARRIELDLARSRASVRARPDA